MSEIKVNLSVILPGRILFSEEECLKTTRKALKKGNKNYFTLVQSPDFNKLNQNHFKVEIEKSGKIVKESITFYTRKCRPASQSINLSKEAYNTMIDKNSCPAWFKNSLWQQMGKKARLETHLERIMQSLGGLSYTYKVFED